MGGYEPYPAYKDSGVEWLGDIPEGWGVIALKRLFKIKKQIAGKLGYDVLSVTQKGIKIKDIESGEGQLAMDYSKYQMVRMDDYVMNHMDLLTGYIDVSKYEGVTSPDYRVFHLTNSAAVGEFYLHLFQLGYKNRIFFPLGRGAAHLGRWRLPTEAFQSFAIPYAPPDEQAQIAAFLDHETAKIDRLIEKQEKLIELLQEKRQAMISHAVTKGLDPNAPMKDSGVEWLGEIPAHWEIYKFSHFASIRNGQVDPREAPFDEYVLIAPNHIESETGKLIKIETASEQGADSGKYVCKQGEVIYSKIRPALAKACICPIESALCSADMYPIRTSPVVDEEYLWRLLLSPGFTALAAMESDRVAMPKINRESINALRFPLPPITEQFSICAFINAETEKIDLVYEKATSAIALLQERRTALISAAVTGKIDVRDWAP